MLNQLTNFNSGNALGPPIAPAAGTQGGTLASPAFDPNSPDGWNDLAARAAIKSAHEKVTRLIKQCKQSIEDVKIAIQMANDRIQDRSIEENALKKVAGLELEITQVLALIPYSKNMHEYKVRQVNEVRVADQIAKERRDLEKVLIEQKLANRTGPGQGGPSRLGLDFSERQTRIKEELRRALGETEEVSGEYSAKLGFDLYFDYILDIPEMHQSCQVIFGVYRQGIAMLRALKTDAHVVEVTPDETKRSLFGEKKNISGIKVVEDAMVFFELQFTNRVDKFQQGSSYGWTALDFFTADKTLK